MEGTAEEREEEGQEEREERKERERNEQGGAIKGKMEGGSGNEGGRERKGRGRFCPQG